MNPNILSDIGTLTAILTVFGGFQLWAAKLVFGNMLNQVLREYATTVSLKDLQSKLDAHQEDMRKRFHDVNNHLNNLAVADLKLDGRISRIEGQ